MDPATVPTYFDKPTAIWLPFSKVDKTNRMVYGFASTETLDAEGESIELTAIADALPDYMKFANIREMHQNSAVGKARDASVITKGDKTGLYLGAKIVDDGAWAKVIEGVYQGFSVGGKKLEKRGNVVTKIHLSEISVVDRPANPDCTFDQVAKRHPLVERDPAVDVALAKAAQSDFKVQTLIFSKDRFKVAGAAKAWAKKNGFESGDVDGTGDSFRLRQFDPSLCKADSQRTFELTDGVQAVGCTVSGVSKLAKVARVTLELKKMAMSMNAESLNKQSPGGNAVLKEAATMPGTETEKEDVMKAHKAAHDQIGKDLAEMAETHKGDAAMCEAIKAAQDEHAKLAEAFKKDDAPGDNEPNGDDAKAKLAAIRTKLAEMAGKTEKNAKGAPESNADWKNASEMIGDLAKSLTTLTGVVAELRKSTPAPSKTRLFSIGKTGDMAPELLAKVDAAAAKAETDKDPMALIKIVHSGALGGVTVN
jgi:phage head maturation protease